MSGKEWKFLPCLNHAGEPIRNRYRCMASKVEQSEFSHKAIIIRVFRDDVDYDQYLEIAPEHVPILEAAPDMLEALQHAKEVIRTWHSIRMLGAEFEAKAWEAYQQSPEMKKINEALSKALPSEGDE